MKFFFTESCEFIGSILSIAYIVSCDEACGNDIYHVGFVYELRRINVIK